MKKTLVVMMLSLGTLSCLAQEKVMNIQKTDGTATQTRVAELKQISFLVTEGGDQGLLVKTLDGKTTAVRFETNPVVTVSSGKLVIKSTAADAVDAVEIEITDIAEIWFGDASDETAIKDLTGFDFVIQDGGALFRGIPENVVPRIVSIDGRSIPTPPYTGGELRLNRATLGTGIFIVKVGTFSAKFSF